MGVSVTATRDGPDEESLRRALDALAAGERPYREDLRAGTAALEDVTAAAAFVADGGRARLRRAARAADRHGDGAAARKARRTLRTLDRFARAAAGVDPETPADGSVETGAGPREGTVEPERTDVGPAGDGGEPEARPAPVHGTDGDRDGDGERRPTTSAPVAERF